MDIYNLVSKEQKEITKYLESCPKRNLAKNFKDFYNHEIFPSIKECHLKNNISDSGIHKFCDSMISHYYEYTYGNETDNIIRRCGSENIKKFYDFCVEYFDSFRGSNKYESYILYNFFQHIFKYMYNAIKGRSKIKMIMIGGHDKTIIKLMNFLDELQIIRRTHFPHYAYNILIELRKYNHDFYLEFYYNDILKYNNTLKKFKSILDNSIYSNINNYCGILPAKSSLIKTINDEDIIINQKNNERNMPKKNEISINESISLNNSNISNNKTKNKKILINYQKNLLLKLISAFILIIFIIEFSRFLYKKKKSKIKRYIKLKKIKVQFQI
jgi:hypothetical protein